MQSANPNEATGALPDSAAMADLRPRLVDGLDRRKNPDGELILVGPGRRQYMTIHEGEEGVLDLLDGGRSFSTLLEDARSLPVPVRPLAVMGLVRRLFGAQMVAGLEDAQGALFGAGERLPRQHGRSPARRLLDARLPVPGLSLLIAPGKPIPERSWPLLQRAALAVFGVGLFAAAGAGRLLEFLDPFGGTHLEVRVPLIYLGVAALLTLRGLARGWMAASMGLRVPAGELRVLFGVLHLGFDDRERRAATRAQRLGLAWTGIASLALGTGLATLAWLFLDDGGLGFAHATAAAGFYLMLADAMPYGRGDVWHVVGIHTAVPDLRRRGATFLLRRTLRNLMRNEPIGAIERMYLAVATGWLAHASLYLLSDFLVPGALRAVMETVRHPAGAEGLASPEAVVALILTLVMLVILLALAVGLAVVAVAGVWQLMRNEQSTPPTRSERVGDAADDLVEELRRVPFMAALDDEGLAGLVAGMRHETHDDAAIIVQQGEPGDRFCFLHQGEAEVLLEEESGLIHRLATLQAGDFFGEIALLREVGRTATVRALGPVEVLSLDRETFITLVESSNFGTEDVLEQVRNAAFLRTVPVFQTLGADQMRSLLAGISVEDRAEGDLVIREGEPGEVMYVIREGACDVLRGTGDEEQHVGRLDEGDFFGEIALLRGIARTATVRVNEAATLVRVPADVLDDMLLADFGVAVGLQRFAAARLRDLEGR